MLLIARTARLTARATIVIVCASVALALGITAYVMVTETLHALAALGGLAALPLGRRTSITRCIGGLPECLGTVEAEHVDTAYPYCRPCRLAAAADASLDDPEQGPRPLAPTAAAEIVDTLLGNATRAGGRAGNDAWIVRNVEITLRTGIESMLVYLPTEGGTSRLDVADRLVDLARSLRILTKRAGDGTVREQLYDHDYDGDWHEQIALTGDAEMLQYARLVDDLLD